MRSALDGHSGVGVIDAFAPPENVLFASNELIASNPEAIRTFLSGWLETTAFIQTHKAEAVPLMAGVTHFSESVTSRDGYSEFSLRSKSGSA